MKNILLTIAAICSLTVLSGCFSFSSEKEGTSTTTEHTSIGPVGSTTTTTTN